MHDILKKALDEALSEKYYAELMGCEDTDYGFSGGFQAEMKSLVRKTDNKLIYYSKYFAVAACAVVAIGCAVLLPGLIRDRIDVSEPESSTTTPVDFDDDANITVTTPEQTSSQPAVIIPSTDETTIDEDSPADTVSPDEDVSDTEDSAPVVTEKEEDGDINVYDPDDENPTAGGGDDEVDENPTSGGDDDVDENPTVDDTDVEDDSEIEGDIVADDDVEDDTEEDVEIEDDTEVEEDDDVAEDDSDDDVVVEEDDADDVVEIEDDADVEEDVDEDVEIEDDCENPETGFVPEFPEGNTFKEIYEIYTESKFENTKVCSVSYYDINNNTRNINGELFDLSFVEEYIIAQADAVRLDKAQREESEPATDAESDAPVAGADSETIPVGEGRSIFVQLGEGELISKKYFYDYSRRNDYGEFFRGEFSEDEDDVEEEDDPFALLVGIEICENGVAYYGNSVPLQFDPVATAELFKHFDKMGLPDFTNSVDELIDYAGITEDSITVGYAKINNVYDIGFNNAAIDTEEEIAGLYNIISSLEGLKCAPSYVNGQVEITFYVSETLSKIKLIIESPFADNPGLYFADDNNHVYYVYVSDSKAKVQEIINYICKCAGVADPYFYVTAEEYLNYVGVDLEGVKEIKAKDDSADGTEYMYIVNDPVKIEKLTDMVLDILGNTKYSGNSSSRTWTYEEFIMDNWSLCICEGYIKIGPYAACCFELSNDDRMSIRKYIKENADEVVKGNREEVVEDVMAEDEVEIEDEIDE